MKRVVLVCVFWIVGVHAQANQVAEYSLVEKVRRSDAALVGRVLALSKVEASGVEIDYALIRVVVDLKDAGFSGDIKVVYREGVYELEPDCCAVDKSYLMFLRKGEDGFFYSVNGAYGIYKITDDDCIGVN
ncbi:hypothetical protein D9M68_326020 [compost metagenome]|uniref:hypothetical protein n=1 Tax=Pseudomonas jinjuensis TaxID=198616 RepID=UPI0011135739|nr:hypothetical protein [Pseudomonas jinjuensis]